MVRRVLAGDVEAYAILVARYRERLGRFAYHMLGNREDAEDALQDALVRAYRSLARCEEPDRFGPYVYQILANRCRTRGARRRRRELTFVADETALARAVASERTAERLAWREELERALATLDPDSRAAFLLKYVDEMSYDEMATLTNVGVSALKMRVKRACERLRRQLEEAMDG